MLDLQVFSLLSLHSWTTTPIFCHEEQREDSHNQRTSLPSQGRVGMSVLQMEEEKTTLQFRKKLNLLWILPWVQTATIPNWLHLICHGLSVSHQLAISSLQKKMSAKEDVRVALEGRQPWWDGCSFSWRRTSSCTSKAAKAQCDASCC